MRKPSSHCWQMGYYGKWQWQTATFLDGHLAIGNKHFSRTNLLARVAVRGLFQKCMKTTIRFLLPYLRNGIEIPII